MTTCPLTKLNAGSSRLHSADEDAVSWLTTYMTTCPLTKLNAGSSRLHSADEDAVSWLTSYGSCHAYEKENSILSKIKQLFYYCCGRPSNC